MSAFILSKEHIDYLVMAGLTLRRFDLPLRWTVPHEHKPTDYQKGQPWGATAIATYQENLRELTPDTVDEVGRMLYLENYRSVHFRYAENPEIELSEPYRFERPRQKITPIQVLKAISSYEYQSCEHPEWEKSEAYRFCQALRHIAISTLPGYEQADWEIRS